MRTYVARFLSKPEVNPFPGKCYVVLAGTGPEAEAAVVHRADTEQADWREWFELQMWPADGTLLCVTHSGYLVRDAHGEVRAFVLTPAAEPRRGPTLGRK